MTLTDIETLTSIIQNLTLTGATLVAAWWAYATFGLKEKNEELMAIARKINEIHSHVQRSILMYQYQNIVVGLTEGDRQKLINVKQGAEGSLNVLCEELSEMQSLSLRVPPVFRVLTIGEYELVLIDLQIRGIEHWSDEGQVTKLSTAKIKVLNEIYREMNRHSSFLRWLGVKISNGVYRIKHIGNSKE